MTFELLKINNFKLDLFLKVWLPFIFVTSVVIIPQIKGTIPAFVLAFLAVFYSLVFSRKASVQILFRVITTIICLALYFLISQLLIFALPFEKQISGDVIFVSKEASLLFKSSFFTQSLYLIASIIILFFITFVYKPEEHDKYLYLGVILILLYGFYELIFFWTTGQFGDFLSNRIFGEGSIGGSLQTITFSSFSTQRFKSLTGEPSMYVFSMFPAFIYTYENGKRKLSYLILLSLVFTFSTTFILGVFLFIIFKILSNGVNNKFVVYTTVLLLIGFIFFFPKIYPVIEKMIIQKLEGSNISGSERSSNFFNHFYYFSEFPFLLKFFGLGFGYVRSTDFLSTLLVNVGIIGFLAYTLLFLYPVLKLGKTIRENSLKIILLFIYVSSILSVPEFAYPSIWLFLGIAYNQLRKRKAILN
jgi:hypothetical protein